MPFSIIVLYCTWLCAAWPNLAVRRLWDDLNVWGGVACSDWKLSFYVSHQLHPSMQTVQVVIIHCLITHFLCSLSYAVRKLLSWLKSSMYHLRTCTGYPMTWVLENTLGHSTDLVTVTTIQTSARITATEGTTVKAKYFKGRREISNILSYATLSSLF